MDADFPLIHHAARETHTSPAYRFDNRTRGGPRVLVLQRTVGGTAFLERHGVRHQVRQGQVMLFFHGEESVYGINTETPEPYHNAYLCLLGGAAEPLFHDLVRRFGPVLPLTDTTAAGRLFSEALQLHLDRAFRDRFHQAEIIYRLLLELHREMAGSPQRLDPAQLLHEAMQNHFHRHLSLKEFAVRTQISREHLSRLFRQHYGEPPAAFLRGLRMRRARLLLETTALTVAAVGEQCGYPDPNVFARSFRRFHGLPPRELRLQMKSAKPAA